MRRRTYSSVDRIMKGWRQRDRLEQLAKAYGEPIAPEQLPPDLRWLTWKPVTQRLYVWCWAWHDGCLYARLDDVHAKGGLWRVAVGDDLRKIWKAIARHLGPLGGAIVAARSLPACVGLI
jgi:hypothetical protein